jgi:Zn-dependent protease
MWAGKRKPDRNWWQRVGVGALTMPVIMGLEWCHNFAHALAARLIEKPMDALRITWGTPLVVYYELNDENVAPREHIIRALGGPVFNAIAFFVSLFIRKMTKPDSVAREVVDTAVFMNAFLSTISLLPIPGIDGGPILKWSLVAKGYRVREADEVVRKVNGLMAGVLGILAVLVWRTGRRFLGFVFGQFGVISGLIGSGLLTEE